MISSSTNPNLQKGDNWFILSLTEQRVYTYYEIVLMLSIILVKSYYLWY